MGGEPDNLILYRQEPIHRHNNRILESVDRLTDEVRGLKVRTTALE